MYAIKDLHFVGDILYVSVRVPKIEWEYEKVCIGEIKLASDVFNEYYLKKYERNVMDFDHKFEATEKMLVMSCSESKLFYEQPSFYYMFGHCDNSHDNLNKMISYAIEQKNICGVYISYYFFTVSLNNLPKKLKYFIAIKVCIKEINLSHNDLLILVLIGCYCNRTTFYYLPENLVLLDLSNTYIKMLKRVSSSVKYLILNNTISPDYSNMVTQNVKSLSLENSDIKYITLSYMKQIGYDRYGSGDEDIKYYTHGPMYVSVNELEYLNITGNWKITINLSNCEKLKKVFFNRMYRSDENNIVDLKIK